MKSRVAIGAIVFLTFFATLTVSLGNTLEILAEGTFEGGLDDWQECSEDDSDAVAVNPGHLSTNSSSGTYALSLGENSCIYQEYIAEENDEFRVTCEAKHRGRGHSEFTLEFLDHDYEPIEPIISVEAQSTKYMQFELNGIAPAGTKFLAFNVYTSASETLLDNCRVSVKRNK